MEFNLVFFPLHFGHSGRVCLFAAFVLFDFIQIVASHAGGGRGKVEGCQRCAVCVREHGVGNRPF